jgi:phosphoribosylaminoimidazole-succinocarboxamide synthase
MTSPKLLFEGSVKNILGEKSENNDQLIFEYSDRYSVFDWGAMPDLLESKGKSLNYMAWLFFEVLGKSETWSNWELNDTYKKVWGENSLLKRFSSKGMNHHMLGMISNENYENHYNNVNSDNTSNMLAVKAVKVVHPESHKKDGKLVWDYNFYKERPKNCLVPLEVIFRFGLEEGSSLLRRANNKEYCDSLGLTKPPVAGDSFDLPIIEFSTKLETTDRYIPYEEAAEIAGLNSNEINNLKDMVGLLACRLKDIFGDLGISLLDGKFEFAFSENVDENGDREFVIVDSIGPDELRLSYQDVRLSKENLRRFYRETPWYGGVQKSKDLADQRGEKDWKSICEGELKLSPPKMDQKSLEIFSMMYKTLANELGKKLLNTPVYQDAWSLEEFKNEYTSNWSGR